MSERHLRTDEIELLLDGEEGFGVAPLRAHAISCERCRAELEIMRAVMASLNSLPDFVPSAGFSDRVMSQVHVFEPWHDAAARTVERFVPSTRPTRIAAGFGAAIGAGLVTAGTAWVVARADMAMVLTQLGLERFREEIIAAVSDLGSTILGRPGLEILHSSSPETIALAIGGFVATAGIGVVGIRAMAASGRAR